MPDISLQGISCRKLDQLNLSVTNGESVAILGESGAGKSTLLKVIAGLLSHSGLVKIGGKLCTALSAQQRNLGYLSQDLHLFPHLSVRNNIHLALLFGFDKKTSRKQRIKEALKLAQATHLEKLYPRNLSGGERQRVALARCLARYPSLLLLDEPFSSLDQHTKSILWEELDNLRRRLSITMLIVTHDPQEAARLADRVVYISNGKLSAHPSTAQKKQSQTNL